MRVPSTNDRQRALANASGRAQGLDIGMTVTSYLIGGLVAYGFIGWLIGHFLIHASWPFPAGMLIGLVISTGYVIYRYGTTAGSASPGDGPRSASPVGDPRTPRNPRKENP
jgi:F0F1-type ATP synthase assembly protein I